MRAAGSARTPSRHPQSRRARASRTIRNIQSVWVKEFEGVVENDQVTQFQVIVKISFLVGEGGSAG